MYPLKPLDEQNLMALVQALGSGLPGSTGMSIMDSILGGAQQRAQAHQQRLDSLIGLVTEQAQSGASLDAAQAVADAYTRGQGIPPALDNAIGALYPTDMVPVPSQSVPSPYAGSTPSEVGAGRLAAQPYQGPPTMVPQQAQTSPLAPPVSLVDQANEMQAAQQIAEMAAPPEKTAGDLANIIKSMQQDGRSAAYIKAQVYADPEAAQILADNISAFKAMFPELFDSNYIPIGP